MQQATTTKIMKLTMLKIPRLCCSVYSVSILTGVGSIKQKDKEPLFDVGSVLIYLVVPFLQLVVQSIFEIPEKNPIFDFINPIFSDHRTPSFALAPFNTCILPYVQFCTENGLYVLIFNFKATVIDKIKWHNDNCSQKKQ